MRTPDRSLETFRRRCRLPKPIPFDPDSTSRYRRIRRPIRPAESRSARQKVCHRWSLQRFQYRSVRCSSPFLLSAACLGSARCSRREPFASAEIVLARSESPFEAWAIAVMAQQVKAHTATVIYSFCMVPLGARGRRRSVYWYPALRSSETSTFPGSAM